MRQRHLIVLVLAGLLASADLFVKATVPTLPADFHLRSPGWMLLSGSLLVLVAALSALPSRTVAVFAGILDGGGGGNLLSAALHGRSVPNPFVLGPVAFNLADVFALVGVLGLTAALARLSVRHRERLLPPRRWERAVLRLVSDRAAAP